MTATPEFALAWISIEHADDFITRHHRHHPPPRGALFAVGLARRGDVIAVAIIGRPVPPAPDDGVTAEVTRTSTNGCAQVIVALYRVVWRAARLRGYRRLITHTDELQIRRGLAAVGLHPVAKLPPRARSHTPRRARADRGVDGVCRIRWEMPSAQSRTASRGEAATSARTAVDRPSGQRGQRRGRAAGPEPIRDPHRHAPFGDPAVLTVCA